MSVFVRWYGSVLQGEVVENQEKGILGVMVAVRIQVQGAKATALFMPGHVYQSAKDASEKEYDPRCAKQKKFEVVVSGNASQISVSAPKVDEKPHEIARNEAKVSIEDLNVLKFKVENWDHERNHLRIDVLDEFYRLWRENMAMRLRTTKPYLPITHPYLEITQGYCEISGTYPSAKPVPQNETPKEPQQPDDPELPAIEFVRPSGPINATQLTLFD